MEELFPQAIVPSPPFREEGGISYLRLQTRSLLICVLLFVMLLSSLRGSKVLHKAFTINKKLVMLLFETSRLNLQFDPFKPLCDHTFI